MCWRRLSKVEQSLYAWVRKKCVTFHYIYILYFPAYSSLRQWLRAIWHRRWRIVIYILWIRYVKESCSYINTSALRTAAFQGPDLANFHLHSISIPRLLSQCLSRPDAIFPSSMSSGQERNGERRRVSFMYRVIHQVREELWLTWNYELRFSINALFCKATHNSMSTKKLLWPDE